MTETQSVQATTGDTTCALPPDQLLGRLAEWRSISSEALARTSGEGFIVSSYPKSEDVKGRLQRLIDAEAECCSFLEFEVRELESTLEVELRYPPEFAPMLTMALADPSFSEEAAGRVP